MTVDYKVLQSFLGRNHGDDTPPPFGWQISWQKLAKQSIATTDHGNRVQYNSFAVYYML